MIRTCKELIEKYSGKKIGKIEVIPDPVVKGCYAIRARIGKRLVQFLITEFHPPVSPKIERDYLSEHIEECTFTSWPPKTSNQK